MICPRCKELGNKSIIRGGLGTVTCAYYPPYYDEEGRYHVHDANVHSCSYTCSKGHHITVSNTGKCPSCNWGHDSEKISVRDVEKHEFSSIPSAVGIIKND